MKSILILAGPSAVGKTTVMEKILSLDDKFEYIRSATTRAPRGDGRDSEYIYLTKDEFLSLVKNARMLEYTEFGGNFYGTPASEIERIRSAGKNPLLILDIEGVSSLKSSSYAEDVTAVYLWDEISVLEARLLERMSLSGASESAQKIFESRKAANIKDYRRIKDLGCLFDVFVRNIEVEASAKKIISAFRYENGKADITEFSDYLNRLL